MMKVFYSRGAYLTSRGTELLIEGWGTYLRGWEATIQEDWSRLKWLEFIPRLILEVKNSKMSVFWGAVWCSDGSMFRRFVPKSVETATLNLFCLSLGSMFRQFDVSTGQCFDNKFATLTCLYLDFNSIFFQFRVDVPTSQYFNKDCCNIDNNVETANLN